MSERKIDKILSNVKMSMEMEGFTIDSELESVGRRIITGELNLETHIADYIANFKRERALAHEI